jgi:hypothetical protein
MFRASDSSSVAGSEVSDARAMCDGSIDRDPPYARRPRGAIATRKTGRARTQASGREDDLAAQTAGLVELVGAGGLCEREDLGDAGP